MSELDTSELKTYVEACASSIYRARVVLIVLITASVLTFVTTWNSRPGSWIAERVKIADNALKIFPDDKTDPATLANVPCKHPPGELLNLISQERSGLSQGEYDAAVCYIADGDIKSRTHIEELFKQQIRVQIEQMMTVRVPFFGVTFDINDIGMFAGLAFVVVLLWFRFSLLRELNNINIAFDKAREEEGRELRLHGLRFCYDLLAMQQVLTLPPTRHQSSLESEHKMPKRFWGVIPKLLYALPFLAQLYVCKNDLATINLVILLKNSSVATVIISELASLVLIIALTGLCIYLSTKIDKTWKDAYNELAELEA